MAQALSKFTVDVLDNNRKKVDSFDLGPFLYKKLEDHGEVYYALKTYEAQTKPKPGYTKGRSEVSGSMKKMYKQKGTGNARHSTNKAPQFVGGGIAHGPKGLKRAVKVNKKVWRKAMQLLLLGHVNQSKVLLFNEVLFKERKTKEAVKRFPETKAEKTIFIDQQNENLAYSVRNLEKAIYKDACFVSIADLAFNDRLVITKPALEVLLKRIQRSVVRGNRA